jgi:hypothetical protein
MKKLSLSLSLIPGDKTFTKGHLPDAKLRLKNEGTDEVVVNSRMLLAPKGYPSRVTEMALSIEGPPGSFNQKRYAINAGVAKAENFVRLLPGEYIDKTYKLDDYFYYDIAGQYKIKAKYHNEIEYKIMGNKSWRGDLESNELNFEII